MFLKQNCSWRGCGLIPGSDLGKLKGPVAVGKRWSLLASICQGGACMSACISGSGREREELKLCYVCDSFQKWHSGISAVWNQCAVILSCLTLCDPTDSTMPSSSICGIFQASILEWVDISSSKGSSWPRGWTWASFILGGFFTEVASKINSLL